MVGLIDMKRKGSASVEYWVNYVTFNFDFTHDLDLELWTIWTLMSSVPKKDDKLNLSLSWPWIFLGQIL